MLAQRFDAASLDKLRAQVLACAEAAGIRGRRALDVVLAVHELAANAVRHGGGSGQLTVEVTATALHCRIADPGQRTVDGSAGPVPQWPVLRGHGLWLVRQAADHLAMTTSPGGSEVTAVFTLP